MDTHFREPDTFVQFSPKTRNRIEKAIEGLLTLLDQMDGDDSLEDTGDDEETGDLEPSLGSSSFWHDGERHEDCELDRSDWEPDGDELDYSRSETNGQWELGVEGKNHD